MASEITGAADVAASIRGRPPAVSAADAASVSLPPAQPIPRNILFPQRRRISFPVVEDALTILDASSVFSGETFLETAAAVRRGAFAITGNLTVETVESVRGALVEAVTLGHSNQQFIDTVTDFMEEGAGLSEARLRMIFRNQVGQRISDSMENSLENPLVVDFFPFRAYFATADTRVRPEHKVLERLGLDGTNIYWALDPVWAMFRPPWDHGCRCNFSPVTVEQAARKGVRVAMDWVARAKAVGEEAGDGFAVHLNELRPKEVPLVPFPPFRPSESFKRI